MAYGVVKKMDNGWVATPNKGTVLDFLSGIEYPFSRPDVAAGTVPGKWNVKTGDIISYTIVNGVATNPVLYKKYERGVVRYKHI